MTATGVTSAFVHEGPIEEAFSAGTKRPTRSGLTRITGRTAEARHEGSRPLASAVDNAMEPTNRPAVNAIVAFILFFLLNAQDARGGYLAQGVRKHKRLQESGLAPSFLALFLTGFYFLHDSLNLIYDIC